MLKLRTIPKKKCSYKKYGLPLLFFFSSFLFPFLFVISALDKVFLGIDENEKKNQNTKIKYAIIK